MSTDDSSRESDLAVMEANEFKQKRRLRRILEAREKVEEKADTAEELWIQGEIGGVARQLIVLRAVREYIRESWQLLVEHADEAHDPDEPCEYLQERVLGAVEFEHSDDRVVIRGLYDILHCQETYTETWREVREFPQGPNQPVTESMQHAVPLEISWRAYLTLNEFLAREHDLEVRFEEMGDNLPTWGFEEVPDIPGTEEVDHEENPTPGEALGDD